MKKLIAFVLGMLMLLSLAACTGGPGNSETTGNDGAGTFRVGYGRVDITPDLGIGLAGFGNDGERRAEAVLDNLYVTCVAITDAEDNTLLLLSCDSIRTETSVANAIRSNISKQLGVPKENILFTSTHCHSTPDPVSGSFSTQVKNGSFDAAKAALEDRSSAEMYIGSTKTEGLNFVRHYIMSDGSFTGDNYGDPTGKTYVKHETDVDNQMQLIKFTRKTGKDIVMMNWQAHPIMTGGWTATDISADFIGSCRESIESSLDCNFIYFQGAAGNVSTYTKIPSENYFTDYERHGFELASYAVDAMEGLQKVETGLIEVKNMDYTGNIRQSSSEYVMACAKFKAVYDATGDRLKAYEASGGLVHSIFACNGVSNRANKGRTFEIELSAVTIGDIGFIGTPNEMFDNTGMQIKEASPCEMTFILGYCNGRANYLPSEPAYSNGCYERDQGFFVKGTAEEMVTVYTSMLEELHAEAPVEKPNDTFVSKLPVVIGE